MSKSLEQRISILEKVLQRETKRRKFLEKSLRSLTGGIPKEIPIPQRELSKLVKENKSTREIAKRFGVSERTIYRRISKYGLKGSRPKGRKPSLIPKIVKKDKWVSVQRYIGKLNRKYDFVNVNYPRTTFINKKTLVCSNEKNNPKGESTTVGIYYIVKNSGVYFIYRTSVKYQDTPVPFDEIYSWIKSSSYDIVSAFWIETAVEAVKVIAYTFINPQNKPEKVSNGRG